MKSDNIKNSEIVLRLRHLVAEHGSQRAAAKALGSESLQSSISNALAGVRMPSAALREAMDAYRSARGEWPDIVEDSPASQGDMALSVKMTFSRVTKNTYRYDAEDAAAPMANVYVLKARLGSDPPKFVEVDLRPVSG